MAWSNTKPAARTSFQMRRAAVLSYEQLVAGTGLSDRVAGPAPTIPPPPARVITVREISANQLAHDPLAHPVAPARPPGAARSAYVVASEAPGRNPAPPSRAEAAASRTKSRYVIAAMRKGLLAESAEPQPEPQTGGPAHVGASVPERSRLSPSQRAALKRPATLLDREGKTSLVNYVVDAAD